MICSLRLRVVLTALLLGTAPLLAQKAPEPPRPTPFAWWRSDQFKKDLGLTADQSVRIDRIWESTRPELRQEWDEFSKLDGKLSHLIQQDADEATLTRQIDRVETARAAANKTRSLMLVQMVKVLSPEQRVRFTALHEKWEREHPLPQRPPSAARRPEH
jgi:Spy/CpxP family protein refolding chaperone